VLKLFGDIAKAKLRGTDIVGRLGGEEFAVLLADADRDNAFLVAERLRSAFATSSIVAADAVVSATVSIGIAIIQDPNEDLTHLLASADEALYRAKANGRNQCVLATIDAPNEGLTDTVSPPVAPGMPRSFAPVRAA
jgi:diguanylate cyclase (GGDEF)-like protein